MWTKRLLYNYYILIVTTDIGQYVKCTIKERIQSFQMSHNTCLSPRLSHRQFLFAFGILHCQQEIKNLTVGRPENEATVTL